MHPVISTEDVKQLLNKLGCEISSVYPTQELDVDLGIDSTELVELAAVVRDEYGIRLKPQAWKEIRTVEDLMILLAEARKPSQQEMGA